MNSEDTVAVWEIAPTVVAVIGTLLGVALTSFLQERQRTKQSGEMRRDRRRSEYLDAAAELASSLSVLIQAESDRARRRLAGEDGELREQARQTAYDRRTEARTAQYRLQLVGDPVDDAALINSAMTVFELSRAISTGTETYAEVSKRNRRAKEALDGLVRVANQRMGELER